MTGPAAIDYTELKRRQQVAWSSGDYAVIGVTLQIVGETLCEAVDLRAGSRVLDVAAGNGNASLAAARRFCDVTSTDYVPALLERGRLRAEAEGLPIHFSGRRRRGPPLPPTPPLTSASPPSASCSPPTRPAPPPSSSASSNPVAASASPPGLPKASVGQFFRVLSKHRPPPPGVSSTFDWGTREALERFFPKASRIHTEKRVMMFRYLNPEHMVHLFRTCYGPVERTFAALPPEGQQALHEDFTGLVRAVNIATDGTCIIPGEYLEAVITC